MLHPGTDRARIVTKKVKYKMKREMTSTVLAQVQQPILKDGESRVLGGRRFWAKLMPLSVKRIVCETPLLHDRYNTVVIVKLHHTTALFGTTTYTRSDASKPL